MERYRVLAHTADTAIEAEAPSLGDLIENLAYGMFDLVVDLDALRPTQSVVVEVTAGTVEDLVVDVLAELLYEAETADLALCSFSARVRDGEHSVRLIANGARTGGELRGPPIKAVTYHDLEVRRRDDGWYGRVVFDV